MPLKFINLGSDTYVFKTHTWSICQTSNIPSDRVSSVDFHILVNLLQRPWLLIIS